MSVQPLVVSTALGPHVAALTCRINGQLAAVINTQIRADPIMRTEAAMALLCIGIDAARTMGALDGVRR